MTVQHNYPIDDIRRWIPGIPVRTPDIRHTFMADLQSCDMYFFLAHRMGLRRRGVSTASWFSGQILHAMMEDYARSHDEVKAMAAASHLIEEERAKLHDHAVKIEMVERLTAATDKLEETGDIGIAMGLFCIEMFPPNPDHLSVHVGEEIELHQIKLPGLKHTAGGRIDKLLWDREEQGLYVCDYKTLDAKLDLSLDGTYAQALTLDHQSRFYATLAINGLRKLPPIAMPESSITTHSDNLKILGHICYAIHRPSIKRKKNQTRDNYIAEVAAWYRGIPFAGARWDAEERAAKIKQFPPIQRFMVRFPWNSRQLHPQTMTLAERTGKACTALPLITNYPQAGRLNGKCDDRYGKPCPYLDICGRRSEDWGSAAHTFYYIEDNHDIEVTIGESN